MNKNFISYPDFKTFYQERYSNSKFPDFFYLTPNRLKLQQARRTIVDSFLPKMMTLGDFLIEEAIKTIKDDEILINNQLSRFLIKEVLKEIDDVKKIAHFEGTISRFSEIFSRLSLNPSIKPDDTDITKAYNLFTEKKKKKKFVDDNDLLQRLSSKKELTHGHSTPVLDSFYKLTEIEWRCLYNVVVNAQGEVIFIGDWFDEFREFFEKDNYSQNLIQNKIITRYRQTLTSLKTESREVFVLPDRVKEVEVIASRLKKWMIAEEDAGNSVNLEKVMVFFYDIRKYLPIVRRIFNDFEIPFYAPEIDGLNTHPYWGFLKKLISLSDNRLSIQDLMLIAESGYFPLKINIKEIFDKRWESFYHNLHEKYEIPVPESYSFEDKDIDLNLILKLAETVSQTNIEMNDPDDRFCHDIVRFQITQIKNSDYDRHKEVAQNLLDNFLIQYPLIMTALSRLAPYITAKKTKDKIHALIGLMNNFNQNDKEDSAIKEIIDKITICLIELQNNLIHIGSDELDPSTIIEVLEQKLSLISLDREPQKNRVMVTGSLATIGLDYDRAYIGSLVERELPPALERSFKWELLKMLEPIDNITESYYMLSKLSKLGTRVEYFFPAADEEGLLNKSPFIIDGGFKEIKDTALADKLDPKGSYYFDYRTLQRSVSSGIRSQNKEGSISSIKSLPDFEKTQRRLKGVIDMISNRESYDRFTEFEGLVGDLFKMNPEKVFSISKLEDLAACPLRFHFKSNLSIEKRVFPEAGVKATTGGTILHKILERFFIERQCTSVQADELDKSFIQIKKIASEEFAAFSIDGDTTYHEFEREDIIRKLLEWLILESRHSNYFTPATISQGQAGIEFKYPLPSERFEIGGFRLTGKIDRIDYHNFKAGFALLDYKKGDAPEFKKLENGLNLQLPTYAYYIQEKTGEPLLIGGYIAFKKDPKYSIQLLNLSFEEITGPNKSDNMGWDYNLLDLRATKNLKLNSAAIRAIDFYNSFIKENGITKLYLELRVIYDQGKFHYTTKDPDVACKYCDYHTICRIDAEKADTINSAKLEKPAPKKSRPITFPLISSQIQKNKRRTPAQEMALDLSRNIVVTAGAGSGKTSILVDRTIKIFSTGIDIDKVLIITFTDNAASEMRDRIYKKLEENRKDPNCSIGIKNAYENFTNNYISTIDSFCMSILREFADKASVNPELKIAHPYTLMQFHEEFVSNYLDKLSDQKDKRLIILMNKWSLGYLKDIFQNHIDDDRFAKWADESSDHSEFIKKLDFPLNDDTKEAIAKVHSTFANLLTEIRKEYIRIKDMMGIYNFSDLRRRSLELLKNSQDVSEILQNRFRYIMVDEFQDTDEFQWELVKILGFDTGKNSIAKDKIFVVGDDKQSIMKFRGADLTVFNKAKDELITANKKFETSLRPYLFEENIDYRPDNTALEGNIVFKQNFRSDENLIDFFNSFFKFLFNEENRAPFHATHQEMICSDAKKGIGNTEFHIVESDDKGNCNHFQLVAALAKHAQDNFSDQRTAILIRSRSSLDGLLSELRKANVRFGVCKGIGFYQKQEIIDLWLLLSFIRNPHDDFVFVGLLRSPILGFSDRDIYSLYLSKDSSESFFEAMAKQDVHKPAFTMLKNWLELKKTKKLQELLEIVTREASLIFSTGLLPGCEQIQANIEKFHSMLSEFEGIDPSIESFLRYLEIQMDEGEREGEGPIHYDSDEPLMVMTIHASKGLEFDNLIIADAFKRPQSDKEPYKVKTDDGSWNVALKALEDDADDEVRKNPYFKRIKEQNTEETIAEEKRLLYVAMTRAKHNLFVIGKHGKGQTGKFKKWIYDYFGIQKDIDENQPKELIRNGLKVLIHEPNLSFIEEFERKNLPDWNEVCSLIDETKLKKVRSVPIFQPTVLYPSNKEDAVKIAPEIIFTKEYIPFADRIPQYVLPDSDLIEQISMKKGSIFHEVMEKNIRSFPAIRNIIRKYFEGYLSEKQLNEMALNMKKQIDIIHDSKVWQSIEKAECRYPELGFYLKQEGFDVSGKIDLLAKLDDGWHIFDFKSDNVTSKEDIDLLLESGYEAQLKAYFKSFEIITGEKPSAASLVFPSWGTCRLTLT
jgi:ATP-dependent exoDNAse (exonuclease V) beta subunit